MEGLRLSITDGRLHLEILAAHSLGRQARQQVRDFAQRAGVTGRDLETLTFIAGELIDNGVDHGGGGGAREASDLKSEVWLTVELEIDSRAWSVSMEDQGGGSPEVLSQLLGDSDTPPDLEDERGRGLFLLVQMIDEVEISASRDNKGVRIQARVSLEVESEE